MITIYGSSWCDDTRRTLRHLRRLLVAHRYLDIDDDLDALERALALTGGRRRTPIVDLGLGGPPLVEPDNDTLTGALVEMAMLTSDEARDRMGAQNIGDLERVTRTLVGVALVAGSSAAPRAVRGVASVVGGILALTGIAGWCPGYYYAGVTSIGGPGDRPDETLRDAWIVPRESFAAPVPEAQEEPSR